MAEAKPFPFTACVDHLNITFDELFVAWLRANGDFRRIGPETRSLAFREFVTLTATTCNFKSEKSLEERRAEVARIRSRHPDRIPVIIQQAEESQMRYPKKKKFLIPDEFNLESFFVSIWRLLYQSEDSPIRSIVEHKDPIFEKRMSSVYEEYKDEDGNLYITLSGEQKDLFQQPIPSNIITWTYYEYA